MWASARDWGRLQGGGRVAGGMQGAPRHWAIRLGSGTSSLGGCGSGEQEDQGGQAAGVSAASQNSLREEENRAQERGTCGQRVRTRAWGPSCPLPRRKLRTRWG